ncbi:MAG: Fur family transcriptional regulator [Gaiellaceae bacterium]
MGKATRSQAWAEQTLASLRTKGRRDGGARRAVIELLGRQSCCLTAQEIFDQLRTGDRQIGIASIYRTLDQLSRDGYLQRIETGSGTTRFEPLHADGEHHHHLVCNDCGKVEAFADDALEKALHAVERKTGYNVAGHDVVLHGVCDDCIPSAAKTR